MITNVYAFEAHGVPTMFGLGTEHHARAFLRQLNHNRAVNQFAMRPALRRTRRGAFLIADALPKTGVAR